MCLQESGRKGSYRPEVCLDGANGIGALQAKKLQPYLGDLLELKIYNDGSSGKLNFQVFNCLYLYKIM